MMDDQQSWSTAFDLRSMKQRTRSRMVVSLLRNFVAADYRAVEGTLVKKLQQKKSQMKQPIMVSLHQWDMISDIRNEKFQDELHLRFEENEAVPLSP